jgi:hypothetical protein
MSEQVTSSRLQVAGNTNTVTCCKVPDTGEYRNTKYKLQVAGCREYKIQLPVARFRLPGNTEVQNTSYRLQVSGNTNTVAGCQVPVTGKYKIQVTGYRFQGIQKYKYKLQGIQKIQSLAQGTNTSYRFQVTGEINTVSKCRLVLFATWNLKPVLNSFTFSHFHFSFYQLLVVI